MNIGLRICAAPLGRHFSFKEPPPAATTPPTNPTKKNEDPTKDGGEKMSHMQKIAVILMIRVVYPKPESYVQLPIYKLAKFILYVIYLFSIAELNFA